MRKRSRKKPSGPKTTAQTLRNLMKPRLPGRLTPIERDADDLLSITHRTTDDAAMEPIMDDRQVAYGLLVQKALAEGKDPAAVLLGHRGGLKGGVARRESMTAQERSASASNAARVRWAMHKKPKRGKSPKR